MAVRLPDTAEPMGNFAGMMAKHIECDDGERLQDKIDNGSLGGGGGGYTQLSQAEYDALTEDEKLNGKEYRTYDTGHIYKLGVEYGKDACFTSLSQLGLTAPTTVGEVFVAMPNKSILMLNVEAIVDDGTNTQTVTDVPKEFGVLTIEKYAPGRHRIEYSSSLGGSASDVRKWIGSIKGNDGTGLRWIELTGSAKIYTTMAQLGLDGATATVQDVMDAISVGEIAMLRSDAFNNNNWQTQCNGIQWGYLKIEKTMNGLSNIELQEVVTPNRRYFGTQSSGKFAGWVQMNRVDGTEITQSVIDTYGTEILKYPIGKWRISNINLGNKLTDLPRYNIGAIITIESIYPTKSPWTDNWAYRQYKFEGSMEDWVFIRTLNSGETAGVINRDSGWKQITTKSIYNSVAELNRAKGTSIELVNGEDNTQKIVDTLSVGEQFISFYHNNANQNRFGIDVSYGNLIHELRITKCLDADLTANYATVTAFMNTGCVMSRIYYKTYSTDWSSTKDYVESLLANS